MLSPEGRCKAFDAGAGGFVRSEGAGMVVLKPLAQALADGDRVYAVIRGTATNQDGRTPGMTVPSQEAQEALLREACRSAGVDPAIDSVRRGPRHGHAGWRPDRGAAPWGGSCPVAGPTEEPCLIASVKTNIGHLEAGAGIAGLIKTALACTIAASPATSISSGRTLTSTGAGCGFACRRPASRGPTAAALRWQGSTRSGSAAPTRTSCCKRHLAPIPASATISA